MLQLRLWNLYRDKRTGTDQGAPENEFNETMQYLYDRAVTFLVRCITAQGVTFRLLFMPIVTSSALLLATSSDPTPNYLKSLLVWALRLSTGIIDL